MAKVKSAAQKEKEQEIMNVLDEKVREAEGFEDFLGLIGALIAKRVFGTLVKQKIAGFFAGIGDNLKFWQ